jgi:hypothetical protein
MPMMMADANTTPHALSPHVPLRDPLPASPLCAWIGSIRTQRSRPLSQHAPSSRCHRNAAASQRMSVQTARGAPALARGAWRWTGRAPANQDGVMTTGGSRRCSIGRWTGRGPARGGPNERGQGTCGRWWRGHTCLRRGVRRCTWASATWSCPTPWSVRHGRPTARRLAARRGASTEGGGEGRARATAGGWRRVVCVCVCVRSCLRDTKRDTEELLLVRGPLRPQLSSQASLLQLGSQASLLRPGPALPSRAWRRPLLAQQPPGPNDALHAPRHVSSSRASATPSGQSAASSKQAAAQTPIPARQVAALACADLS